MAGKDTIVRAALECFALSGYLGTSVQQIADAVGTSKSAVLYHFASKEAILDAAMQPALDEIERRLESYRDLGQTALGADAVRGIATDFVDTLLRHAHALTIFVSQRGALREYAAIRRADALVDRVAERLLTSSSRLDDSMRLGIGLAGAVFVVAMPPKESPAARMSAEITPEHKREVLINTILELCPPLGEVDG